MSSLNSFVRLSCLSAAILATGLPVFAQTPAAPAPAAPAEVTALLTQLGDANFSIRYEEENYSLANLGIRFNASSLPYCTSVVDDRLSTLQFGAAACANSASATLLSAPVPVGQCALIVYADRAGRSINMTVTLGNQSVDSDQNTVLVCNKGQTPLAIDSIETEASPRSTHGAFTRLDFSIAGVDRTAPLVAQMNNVLENLRRQRLNRGGMGPLAVTPSQLSQVNVDQVSFCNANFPQQAAPAPAAQPAAANSRANNNNSDDGRDNAPARQEYSFLNMNGQITARNSTNHGCANPGAILAPVSAGRCVLIFAGASDQNNIDLRARVGSSGDFDTDDFNDSFPLAIACNNGTTAQPLTLEGRLSDGRSGSALIGRIEFAPQAGVNVPLTLNNGASAFTEFLTSLRRMLPSSSDRITEQSVSGLVAAELPYCATTFQAFDHSASDAESVPGATNMWTRLVARARTDSSHSCSAQQAQAISAPLPANRCALIVNYGMIQNTEHSDIDTLVALGSGRSRPQSLNQAINNFPVNLVCNTSNASMAVHIGGLQSKEGMGRSVDAFITRFDFDLPAENNNQNDRRDEQRPNNSNQQPAARPNGSGQRPAPRAPGSGQPAAGGAAARSGGADPVLN